MTKWNPLKRLRSKRAGVTILAATAFPVMIGMAGLATAYGDALLTKLKAQRIADAAAYSGAVAYNQLGTSTAITNAANRDATVNGIPTSDMSASLVSSPTGDGNSAVKATVTMSVSAGLAQLVNSTSSLSVSANSYVELKGTTNGIPCVIALGSSGTGITLSGSGAITANTCAVASNSSTAPAITAPNGTTITTPVVSTPAALTSTQKANISPPTGTAAVTYVVKTVTDPLASKSTVTTDVGHLAAVGLLSNPTFTAPTGGTSVTFGYQQAGTYTIGPCSGVTGNYNGVWVVTCTGAGPFNFGTIDMTSGASFTFNDTTTATYNISGAISVGGGATVAFNGAGTYNIGGGIYTGGGSTTAFNGAGTFNIGQNATSCNGDYFSICHTGSTLTFAGPSNFLLTNGIYDSGGETMTLGSGTTNSYQIGASTNGYAINMGGGSFVTLNDASGALSQFQATGNITNGGGSCLALPAATAHDINGYVLLGGGATLGSGTYTIYDYMSLGSGGGGAVTCGGASVGLKASSVTLVIGANSTVTCGSVTTTGFCVTGGYSNVTLTAPTATNIAVIGPTTSTNTSGAVLTAGASGASITGAFYFPDGPFSMSGGASVGGGGCFEIIANQVTMSGGTALASTCTGLGGPSLVNNLALVQ